MYKVVFRNEMDGQTDWIKKCKLHEGTQTIEGQQTDRNDKVATVDQKN